MADPVLTPSQIEALKAVYTASDGWLSRGSSRIWGMAPMTIKSHVRKGLLELHCHHAKVRLTAKGRALVESDLERFNVMLRRLP